MAGAPTRVATIGSWKARQGAHCCSDVTRNIREREYLERTLQKAIEKNNLMDVCRVAKIDQGNGQIPRVLRGWLS
jgi:hypothetical protein